MKIEKNYQEDHQMQLKVEADNDQLESAKRKAARQLAKRVKIPGFRPGKAPYNIIERHVGQAAILEEAIELLADEIYPDAIDEAGIKPFGPGMLEEVVSVDPPVLQFKVPLEAEVKLGEYHNIRIEYNPEAVSPDEIEKVVSDLRERQAITAQVDRPAEEGDQLRIQINGKLTDPEEGNDGNIINNRTLPVIVEPEDADSKDEWPFPGFSRQMIGLKAGDEKSLEYTFEEDSPYESLRGHHAVFDVTVESVSSRTLPELDDEFAQSIGDFETYEALRKQIVEEMETRALDEYHKKYDEQIIEKLLDDAEIKFPPQMLDREVEDLLDDLKHRLEHQGLDLDTYLKISDMSMEALRADLEEAGGKRLRKSLVVYEVSKAEEVQVSEEEVQQQAIETLNSLTQSLPQSELKKLSDRNVFTNLIGSIMAEKLSEKSIKRLRNIARGISEDEEQEPAETEEEPAEESETGMTGAILESAVEEPAAEPDVPEAVAEEAVEEETAK